MSLQTFARMASRVVRVSILVLTILAILYVLWSCLT